VTNLHDSGAGSLRAAVQYANSHANTTIKFAAGLHGTIRLTSGELAITQSATIDGPGAQQLAVSGTGRSRVFDISSGTAVVTISGLKITRGLADNKAPMKLKHGLGGGILNHGDLTLKHVVVSHNKAVGEATDKMSISGYDLRGAGAGGGVANLGTLTVSDSKFEKNQALGASQSQDSKADPTDTYPGVAAGGGLANLGMAQATVTSCRFTGNVARGGDGCFGTQHPHTTAPLTYTDIAGDAAGGAVASFGFTDPQASPNAPKNTATLNVKSSHFSNNQAVGGSNNQSPVLPGHSFGGAIASHRMNGSAVLEVSNNCTFDNNRAIGGDNNVVTPGAPAGDLRVVPNMAAAGGVFACGTGAISDSKFDGNRAIGGRGGDPGSTGLAITKNGGDARGGGIGVAFSGTVVNVSNCTVKDSVAAGGQAGAGGGGGNAWGGGVGNTAKGPNLTVTGSRIGRNQARGGRADTSGPPSNGGNGRGGGVFTVSGATTTVTGSKITRNGARGVKGMHGGSDGQGIGGGVYNLGTFTYPGTIIRRNRASTSNDDIYP
jgi:hypothetical protein